jgi:leader peptidase (prepilin peptidase) / N-methyltransferase
MVPAASLAFVGGMLTGSFVGVVAHRVPRGLSIVGPRSVCDSCGTQIAAYDNVPVFSWLLLRGHCRNCSEKIPARYPLVELGVGIAFAATAIVLRDDPAQLALGLVFVAVLAAITLTDLERRIIPNAILIVGAIAGVAIAAATDPASLPERGLAALGGGGFLLLAALIYPRGMGMGDVKLAAMMGIYLGASIVPAMFIGIALGGVAGMGLMARYGSEARKHALPFGPFLAIGGVVGLLAGSQMIDWYLNTFVH